MNLTKFFEYARERESIKRKREKGLPKPWTEDEILQEYSFCNIFREDDKTTKWFRENLREPARNDRDVLLKTVIFRWFNRIETGERLLSLMTQLPYTYSEFRKKAWEILQDVSPTVTGAYIIKAPSGMSKTEGVLEIIKPFWGVTLSPTSLQKAHEFLLQFPYMGNFTAYEVVTDLRHTHICENAEDINTWASAGPGAARGLARIRGLDLKFYNYHSKIDQLQLNTLMREILEASREEKNWPQEWGKWEMREVEHTLCEFDKYTRLKLGEGKVKQKFSGRPRRDICKEPLIA